MVVLAFPAVERLRLGAAVAGGLLLADRLLEADAVERCPPADLDFAWLVDRLDFEAAAAAGVRRLAVAFDLVTGAIVNRSVNYR